MIKIILKTFGSKFFSIIVSFGVVILTTQTLGAEGRGMISIVTATIGMIGLICGFTGGSALVFVLPRQNQRLVLGIAYLGNIGLGVLAAFGCMVFGLYDKSLLGIVLALSILNAFLNTNTNGLIANGRINKANIAGILNSGSIFIAFFAFTIVVRWRSPIAYFLSMGCALGAAFLFSGYSLLDKLVNRKISWDARAFGRAVKVTVITGFMAQLCNVIQYLNYRLSFYFLDSLFGKADTGIYSIGVTLAEAVWMMSSSIALLQYSSIANCDDIEYSKTLTLKMAKLSFISTSLIMMPLLMLPAGFYSLIFGHDFSTVKIVLLFQAPGIVLFSLNIIIASFYAGRGRYWVNAAASLTGLVVSVAANVWIVPRLGYQGASIASTLSYSASTIFAVTYFLRDTSLPLKNLLVGKADIEYVALIVKHFYSKMTSRC